MMNTHTAAMPIANDLLARVLDDCAPLVGEHAPESEALRLELLRQHRQNRRQILLHGGYNAGKSTLINALLGEQRAAVGAIPTTASVDRYDLGRLELLDTPGVNAPVEHEAITEQALKSAHLVMFVVREGDQDVADVYRRLFKLLASGRPVMLVLNHQASHVEQIEQQRQRMLELLVSQAQAHGVADTLLDNLPVVPVNAQMGLKGRLENKPLLVEASGLDDLGLQMATWLEQAEAEANWSERIARRALDELLRPLATSLQARLGDTGALGQVSQQLELMSARIDRLHTDLRLHAAALVQRSKADIGRTLDQVTDTNKRELLDSRLQEIAETAHQKLAERLVDGVQTLGEQLERSHKAVSIPAPDLGQLLGDGDSFLGKLESLFTKTGATAFKKVGKDELLSAFKLLRKLKVPIFKGRWEKTLAKWAQRGAIGVQIGAGVVEFFVDKREERKINEARRSVVLQRQQVIEGIAATIRAALDAFINEQIGQLRDKLLAPLREERSRMTSGQGQLGSQLDQLAEWVNELQALVKEDAA